MKPHVLRHAPNAPLEAVPEAAFSSSHGDALVAAVEAILDGLAARRLVSRTMAWTRLPYEGRAVVFSMLLLVAFAGGGVLAGEPAPMIGVQVWSAALLLVSLVAYEWLGRALVSITRENVAPELPAVAIQRAVDFGRRTWLVRGQIPISLAIGATTAALVAAGLWLLTGSFAPLTCLFVLLGSTLTANLVYVPTIATVLSVLAFVERAPLFALDPRRSAIVRGLQQMGRYTTWVTAILATVGVAGPFLLPGLGELSVVLATLVLLGAVSATAGQFVVSHLLLTRLVAARRDQTLTEIQADLDPLYARRCALGAEDLEQLRALALLHDKVAAAPATANSLLDTYRAVRPMVMPIATAVLGILEVQLPSDGPVSALLRFLLS